MIANFFSHNVELLHYFVCNNYVNELYYILLM